MDKQFLNNFACLHHIYQQKGNACRRRRYSLEQLIEEAQKAEASGEFGTRYCGLDKFVVPSGSMDLGIET